MEQLYQARILYTPGQPSICDGALVANAGRIVAVGARSALRKDYPAARITDFGDAIILPPLVNAHTHLELTLFPEWARLFNEKGTSPTFVDWMLRMVRVKRQIAREAFAPAVATGLRASLQSGVGAIGDILSSFWARSAYLDTPMLGRVFFEILGRDPARNHQLLSSVTALLDAHYGALLPALSPHAPYTISAEFLANVMTLATEKKLPLAIHLAESSDEVEFLQTATGPLIDKFYPFVGWRDTMPIATAKTPLTWLASCGQLSSRTLLIHAVQVTTADIQAIAAARASVVLCPRSNHRLHVGKAPAGAMHRAGIRLALGTDSLASNDSLSIWDELAFARTWFNGELDSPALLAMATINGAAALGLVGELGRLAAGWGTHFQVLRPAALPRLTEVEDFLTAPGRDAEVKALYLHGRNQLTGQGSISR
ncbi:MAG: amidohydrolase family protein [Desulfuromonadaceae bacterium]|nr:amidohydrolase family protein [Desulfuromonadaceae bacterium]